MAPSSRRQLLEHSKLSRRFIIMMVLFLTVLLGLLTYTMTTLHKDNSNALLIDLAGSQRMLLQKHSHEIFLTSQGMSADYPSTRHLILSTLNTLMQGGSSPVNLEIDQHQKVPAVPTQEIFEKLREQQNHIEYTFQLADQFLKLLPDHPEFGSKLQTLRTQHSLAIQSADEAVKQLNKYSEAAMTTMVKWEVIMAILVGLLGILAISKVVRDGRRLENEVEDRERAQSALRKNEMFLNSIVENIPHMIFIKTARDLTFIRLNKAGEELLETSRKNLLGKTDYDMFPKEQADFFVKKDREVLAKKSLVDITEEPIQTKSKGLRHLHTKKIPLFDDQGRPEYLLGISHDITERKQAEEMIIRSRDFSLTLLDKFPAFVWRSSLDGKCDYFNQTWLTFTGRRLEEEWGGGWTDGVHPEDRDRCVSTCQRAFEARQRFEMEFRLRRYDGEYRWILDVGHPFNNLDGEFVGFIGSCYDITDRKEGEQVLQEWKALTDSMLGQLPKGFAYRCLNDKTWSIIYISEGVEEVTGIPASAFFSGTMTYDTLMAPGENERVWPLIQDALAKHLPYENEHQIITHDGKTKWILARGRFVFDETGQLLYLDGLNIDITERKHIENDLRASEARFRALIEHIPFCIHEMTLDGTISSMNKAGQRMMGIETESQVIGHSYLELVEEHDHERFRGYFTEAVQGQQVNCEFSVTTHERIHVFTKNFIPIRGQDGEVCKVLGISEDITERRLAEERLTQSEAKQRDALRQSDELKSALLASVSHELKTPLTAMKTSISSLTGNAPSRLTTLQYEFLYGVDQEINYMSRLVDNLLDMSQIEAGILRPHREWHPLEDLIEAALRLTEQRLKRQNIEILIPETLPPIYVDALGIQQVLINLFDNAAKYSTPHSIIQLHVLEKLQQVIIQISNEGEPIQTQDLERIFDRFYRCQSRRSQPIRGTGLGLAICKGIVEAHGGEIWAESIGSNVTITFILPVTEAMASFSLEGLQKG